MPSCTITPGPLKGKITPPPSREIALRLVWGAALGEGGLIGNCPDTPSIRALIDVGTQIGADIAFEKNTADIFTSGTPLPVDEISCGNNQTSSRFALPLSFFFGKIANIKNFKIPPSPLAWLDDASAQLGVRITKTSANISVSGPPEHEWLEFGARAGEFFAPGFMMAMPVALDNLFFATDDFTMNHPAVQNTFEALTVFGIEYSFDKEHGTITIPPDTGYMNRNVDVPPDWKTGSYYLGALLLAGEGEVMLWDFSKQPENKFWDIFRANNLLNTSESGTSIKVKCSLPLYLPPTMDLRPYPSLLPLAIVFASQCHRTTKIGPLYPMSKPALMRAKNIILQLNKLGANITSDGAFINVPYFSFNGGEVDSCGDPRVAMALALAALCANAPVKIKNCEAVDKVHPFFWGDLKRLGADIKYDKESK